jgi:hypothetical protein
MLLVSQTYDSMQNVRSVVFLLRFATYCIIVIILCLVCISTFIKRKYIKTTEAYCFSLSYSQKGTKTDIIKQLDD